MRARHRIKKYKGRKENAMENTIMLKEMLKVAKAKYAQYQDELDELNDNISDSSPESDWDLLHELRINVVPACKDSVDALEKAIENISYLEQQGRFPQP